jgi:hypothetical protein
VSSEPFARAGIEIRGGGVQARPDRYHAVQHTTQGSSMPKPNYQFEKRQRELAKKQKKEEKAQRKAIPPAAPAEPQNLEK